MNRTGTFILLLCTASGCAGPSILRRPPVRATHIRWPGVAAVKVPAKAGLVVEIAAGDLFEVAPFLRRGAGLSVRYRGRPVEFAVTGGEGGRLHPSDSVLFTVSRRNRHSPYLVYTIEKAEGIPAKRTTLPPQASRFRAKPFLQWAPAGSRPAPEDGPPAWVRAMGFDPNMDYLILASRDLLRSAEPLMALRKRQGHRPSSAALEELFALLSGGNPDPLALQSAVRTLRKYTRGRLRFLFLVGDAEEQYRPDGTADAPLPAFYLPKMAYGPGPHDADFPSDAPYANGSPGPGLPSFPPLAVGRLPARTPAQVAGYVRKVIGYETREPAGPWQRKLAVLAGPAGYGPVVDRVIETLARRFFENQVPYLYDLRLIFAKPGSPYAYRFDRIGQRFVRELNSGALVAAYVGHERLRGFDVVWYRSRSYLIATREDVRRIRIPAGKPFFLLISCTHGAFDYPGGYPSVAELMVLNPHGPVAVFAASRPSHPYPNYLYGLAFAERFLKSRPSTVGEGVYAMKQAMARLAIPFVGMLLGTNTGALKVEHQSLYNLFGDPAVRLRYPRRSSVTVRIRPGPGHGPGAGTSAGTSASAGTLTAATARSVLVEARSPIRTGRALVTIEILRSRMIAPLSPVPRSMPLDRAFLTIARNYEAAMNKVLTRKHCPVTDGAVRCSLPTRLDPGTHVAKVFVTGQRNGAAAGRSEAAAGHTLFTLP